MLARVLRSLQLLYQNPLFPSKRFQLKSLQRKNSQQKKVKILKINLKVNRNIFKLSLGVEKKRDTTEYSNDDFDFEP